MRAELKWLGFAGKKRRGTEKNCEDEDLEEGSISRDMRQIKIIRLQFFSV